MEIPAFQTEHFFAQYEFSTPYLLSVSDCESLTIAELLALAGVSAAQFGDVHLGYTESQGNPLLRAQIAARYESITADNVLVFNSPIEGIYVALRALLSPGDEVIATAPAYDALTNLPDYLAAVKRWELQPTATGWQLDLDALAALVTDKTKVLLVNFPHNPTGYVPTVDEFDALIDLARQYDLWLFSDEMYRGLEHARPTLPSAIDRYEKTVTLAGLSKTYGLPGLRAGWLLLHDADLYASLFNWKLYTSICPPAPVEFLATAAHAVLDQLAARNNQIVRDNLALTDAFFARHTELATWRRPLAGSTALVELHVPSTRQYALDLIDAAGVLLLPADCLGAPDRFVRMGFGRRNFAAALNAWDAHLT